VKKLKLNRKKQLILKVTKLKHLFPKPLLNVKKKKIFLYKNVKK